MAANSVCNTNPSSRARSLASATSAWARQSAPTLTGFSPGFTLQWNTPLSSDEDQAKHLQQGTFPHPFGPVTSTISPRFQAKTWDLDCEAIDSVARVQRRFSALDQHPLGPTARNPGEPDRRPTSLRSGEVHPVLPHHPRRSSTAQACRLMAPFRTPPASFAPRFPGLVQVHHVALVGQVIEIFPSGSRVGYFRGSLRQGPGSRSRAIREAKEIK